MTTESSRPLPRLLALVVAALLLLLGLAALSSHRDLAASRERRQTLQEEIRLTHEENEALAQRIERLRSDPATLERLAREQYRMKRPEDVVIVLPEEAQEVPLGQPVSGGKVAVPATNIDPNTG